MEVRTATKGPFATNSHFVYRDAGQVILVDAGFQPEELLQAADEQSLRVAAILITHGHGDHMMGAEWLRRAIGCPLYFPKGDMVLVTGSFMGVSYDPPQPTKLLRGGERLQFAQMEIEVLAVPGHSPGHLAYRIGDAIFSGDCLFRGSVGRTDLPHADGAQLQRSLQALLQLPDATTVYPGHGPVTSIGRERRDNPFLEF